MTLIRIIASMVLFGLSARGLYSQISTPENPYGIAGHGHYWEEVDSINVKWARMWSQDGAALWGEVQPTHIDSFYWDDLDAWVKEIHGEGYHMMLKIRTGGDSTSFHPCKWTDHSNEPDVHPWLPSNFILYKEASFPPNDYQEWHDFVYAVVERYDGNHTDASGDTLPEIQYFETQAENDIPFYWYGTKEEYYDQFLPIFYRAVHDANPNAVVVGGSVTGEGAGLAIIDSMINANIDTATIVDYYHHYFYDSDSVTWTEIADENTASQRRIDFVNYSFNPYKDTIYYDKRGFHNYERWNKLRDHLSFERNRMSAFGYSKPLWGTEVGIFNPATFPLVPEQIHAQQYQKKMIIQLAENVEWFCFAPMTSNPNNNVTNIFSPMYSLVPFGTPVARELRDAFAFIAGKINEVTGYSFDHKEPMGNVNLYYFTTASSRNTCLAAWAQGGDTLSVTIDIPDNLDTLFKYDYLGIPSLLSQGDSLTLVYTANPVFIEWKPSSINYVFEAAKINSAASDIKIYPNPFRDYTIIEFDNPKNENYSINIYSCMGQKVRSLNNITSGNTSIEKGALTSGVYFLELRNTRQIMNISKIIIK